MSLSLNLWMPPVNLNGAIARRSWSASVCGEAGRDHRDLHRLFLKERHAERLPKNLLQCRLWKFDRLPAFAPAEIRVHHVALNRARPNDGDFDDEIVKGLWLLYAAASTSVRGFRSGRRR